VTAEQDATLERRLEELPDGVAHAAVRNLRIALERKYCRLDDGQVRAALEELTLDGDAAAIRDRIVSTDEPGDEAGDLSRALLAEAAADPEIEPFVVDAVTDAEAAGTQDFGLTTLIVIGAVSLLWRWRPKSVEKNADGFKIEWPDDKDGDGGLGTVLDAMGKAAGL
jgi:predicted exporter